MDGQVGGMMDREKPFPRPGSAVVAALLVTHREGEEERKRIDGQR